MTRSARANSLIVLVSIALAVGNPPAEAQAPVAELAVGPGDIRVEQRGDEGYHLFVRAKPGIGSVLLTETTRDPEGKAANYAYRAERYNAINGDEKRKLDGAFMESPSARYSLIDSSPEPDQAFGRAFHIFIPWVAVWGYPWTRNGREFIADGTFINIRAFTLPYADYAGAFADNPFVLSVTQKPFERPAPAPMPPEPAKAAPEPDLSAYMPETVRTFSGIASSNDGVTRYSEGCEDIVPTLAAILDAVEGDELELVICLDTTESMEDDIDAVKELLPRMVGEKTARFKSFRLGLVLYKDYFEEYVVKRFDFTADISSFTTAVAGVKVRGGRDIPEAVYEALYEAVAGYAWTAKARAVVLIGDAPPHPLPRGKIDKAKVDAKAEELGVSISVIILPH